MVSGFQFLVTPLVRDGSLILSFEIPGLGCCCLNQDLQDLQDLGDFRDCRRPDDGWSADPFLRRVKGQIAEGQQIGNNSGDIGA